VNEDLVREIGKVRFTPVRLREGYDMGEVDRFLDELETDVAAGRSIRTRVDQARFTPVRLREGYDMGAVDHFLEWLAVAMEARLVHPEHVTTDDAGPAPEATRELGQAPPAARTPSVAAQTSSVIKEQPGLWARVFRRNR
jgi:DivIVA domain-containing protein